MAHLLRSIVQYIWITTHQGDMKKSEKQRNNVKPVEPANQKPRDNKNKKRNLCPFLNSPFKDCYPLDMNSNKISMVIYYCQNHYKQCDIYKRTGGGRHDE